MEGGGGARENKKTQKNILSKNIWIFFSGFKKLIDIFPPISIVHPTRYQWGVVHLITPQFHSITREGGDWWCVGHLFRKDAREAFKMDTVGFEAVGFEWGTHVWPYGSERGGRPLLLCFFFLFLTLEKKQEPKQ